MEVNGGLIKKTILCGVVSWIQVASKDRLEAFSLENAFQFC